MLQNGVGWTTSRSILGTRRLAVRSRAGRSPITPKIIPGVPIAPIVPVGPTPAPRTPAPVAPPISPGEMEIVVVGLRLRPGDRGKCLANGSQPFRDPGPLGGRRLRAQRMLIGDARRRRGEQERDAGGSGGYDAGQDLEVFLPQRHQNHPSSTRMLL